MARDNRDWCLKTPGGANPHSQIKHLIVLMLENRSFDHMLGYSRIPGVNGVWDKPEHGTSSDAAHVEDLRDPGHDIADVKLQLYGPDAGDDPWANDPQAMLRENFVASYAQYNSDDPAAVMKCHLCRDVPVLTGLAKEFAVCNYWFSSIPGPTLPNRLFAHAGTSNNRLDMSAEAFDIVENIYTVLDEANVPSTIYGDSWTGTATFPKLLAHQDQFFGTLDDFYQDCYDNNLPAYCFIEPRYSSGVVDGTFRPQNDQHPDSDINEGEQLIYSIYKAIRSNRAVWMSSIFVVTYDEHGGLYDHVAPPAAVSPGGPGSRDPKFTFNRYGMRVPAVIVSAYTPHMVIDKRFDHTSLIATARKLFTPQYRDNKLGNRAMCANTFDEDVLVEGECRTDHIETILIEGERLDFCPRPVHRGKHDKKALEKCLNHLQIQNLQQAIALNEKLGSLRVQPGATLSRYIEANDFCHIQAKDAEHFIQNVMTTFRHSGVYKSSLKELQQTPAPPLQKCEQEKPE